MDTVPQKPGSSSTPKHSDHSYGAFKVKLAALFTLRIVLDLATYFNFSRAKYDQLERAEYPGQLLVNQMHERGLTNVNDISPLVNALEELHLDGVKEEVLTIYETHTSLNAGILGKLRILQNGLKTVYKTFYKRIQPIPYIRDKLYCVDEVFVESGIQLVKRTGKNKPSRDTEGDATWTEDVPVKSYSDIFDNTVLSSNRIIIEGEPGYGKSTLTLQAAYDWSEAKLPSTLAGFEVFILLQFRLLRGIKSIYEAIKLFALPRDCKLTESDIEDILTSGVRVVIVLDGYDEYPDMTSDTNSDMMEIIKGRMFNGQKSVICTRTGCLPGNIDPETLYVRLTGFDDEARDQYIRTVVGEGSNEFANEIKSDLHENPIMSDLCQVPLFFVMFAHMASDGKDILKCNSVTKFFKHMVRCFYNHMWKKNNEHVPHDRFPPQTVDKSRLCKLAFEGLTEEKQTLVWEKQEFIDIAGRECCEELLKLGILIEEKLTNDLTDSTAVDAVPYRYVIRFYHKVFTEWYAAHHLGELTTNFSFFRNWRLGRILQRINPQDVQFVFRFACGLNPITFTSIFKYLRGFNYDVATLCIFEAASELDEIKNVVKKMCSKGVMFVGIQSRLLQRSRIQLLTLASENQIPIPSVILNDSFQSVDVREESLCLSSGLQLPRLDTLQELVIGYFLRTDDLRDRARDILDYSARCAELKTLKFGLDYVLTYLGNVLLPQSFEDRDVLASLYRKNTKVQWKYYDWYHGEVVWTLNLKTGKWENEADRVMTNEEYKFVHYDVLRYFETLSGKE